MQFEGYIGRISAHNRSEITRIIMSKHHPGMIVSIGHDNFINLISSDLKIQRSVKLHTEYLNSLINYKQGFLVGTDGGYLYQLNKEFEVQNKIQVDTDCISDIVQSEDYFITASYQGNVIFLQKEKLTKVKQLKFDIVFNNLTLYNKILYASGNPSFQINIETFESRQIQRTEKILLFKDQAYQFSDESEFGKLKAKQQNGIPCQFAMVIQQFIMVVFDQEIGFISNSNWGEDDVQYKFCKLQKLPIGDIVKTAAYYNGNIYLGLENGTIHQLKVKLS